jgi:hypothetical protein
MIPCELLKTRAGPLLIISFYFPGPLFVTSISGFLVQDQTFQGPATLTDVCVRHGKGRSRNCVSYSRITWLTQNTVPPLE